MYTTQYLIESLETFTLSTKVIPEWKPSIQRYGWKISIPGTEDCMEIQIKELRKLIKKSH